MKGEVAVALINPKYPHNVGAAIRGMSCFTNGGRLMFTGDRVNPEEMDRIPREERMKAYATVNWAKVEKPTVEVPHLTPVVVELLPGATPLRYFEHPENALYIFGPEDGSVGAGVRNAAHHFVVIESQHCMNLSVAVNLLLHDRAYKQFLATGEAMPELVEERGFVESNWAENDFDLMAKSV